MASDTRYPLRRSKARKTVLAAITEGLSDAQIAARLDSQGIKVSPQAITKWRHRNQVEIESTVATIEREVTDYAIAHKVNRIADYESLRQQYLAALAAEGALWSEDTRYGRKLHLNPVAVELRAVNKAAAEELDQLPRAGVTVNNQNVVIVKTVSGSEGELG